MGIADEIAAVAGEFVSGETLFVALMERENLGVPQLASWFVRNIVKLNELPMYAYNASKRDFRRISEPWSHDMFFDLVRGN